MSKKTFKAGAPLGKSLTFLPGAWLWPAGPPIWQITTLGAAVALTSVAVPTLPTVLPDKPPPAESPAAQAPAQDEESDAPEDGGAPDAVPGSDPTSVPTVTGVTPSTEPSETPSEAPKETKDVSKPSNSGSPEASDEPNPTATDPAATQPPTEPQPSSEPEVPAAQPITVAAADSANQRWLVSAVDCATCVSGSRIIGLGLLATLTVPVESDTAGTRQLSIAYESKRQRDLYVSVNGGAAQKLTVEGTGGWETPGWTSVSVDLQQGKNSIKFHNPIGLAPDLDQISVN
ncbi:hypothetical protein Kisp01_59940 [Kineosporia sp. NBRC 101677]|uniref:hypothetical protein n=1 Tax=Kineosporia sp. NBRC 101677 TaxID=3032197 RepID=UPI0024A5EBFF|nr:hypothetical protein [Kineosporia sp. NBRC 101677]GLY18980.1 hypothetical protein Kisp01_59940 [Kineosporia sp. NBRC 101677]